MQPRDETRADLGMPGRIGMDAVMQQLLIGARSRPGLEEIKIGNGCFGSGPFDRRIDHRDGRIPVRPVRHPGNRGGAGFIHRRESDPAQPGGPRPGTPQERSDIGADVCRRRQRTAIDVLGIIDAGGKHDEVPVLAASALS